jgi:hypothetical protein
LLIGGRGTDKQLKQNNYQKEKKIKHRKRESNVPSVPVESIDGIRHL